MLKDIFSFLPPEHPWISRIRYYDILDSTNTEAKRLVSEGAEHGTVVIAGEQTRGRGRMGRSFHSPAGLGIYLSVILRPDCTPGQLMHLTCAAGVAMCDAVEKAAGFRPGIKWTNDLVFGKRKLGGILTELSLDSSTGKVRYAVVGVGINCRHTPEDFPPELRCTAGSLSMVTGTPITPARTAAAMIESLEAMSRALLRDKAAILDRYRADCITVGQEVSIHRIDETRHGIAVGVDEEGGLLVRFPDGHTEVIAAGEVSIRGMYGYV